MEMCAAADQSWVSLPGKARAGFPCPGGATPVRAANPHLGLRGQPPGPSNEPSRETEHKVFRDIWHPPSPANKQEVAKPG